MKEDGLLAKDKKSVLYIIIAAVCFGSMEVSLKIAGASFDAFQLTFLRFLIGGIVLLPFSIADLKKRKVKLSVSDYLYMLLLGIICICVSMTLFQIGVMQTNANLAAIIISINPVFTMIFAHFIADDKFTKKKALVLILSIIGLVIYANPKSFLSGGTSVKGVIIVLMASISFGLYTALGKKRVDKIGGLSQCSISFILGSVVQLIIMLFMKEPIFKGINSSNILILLYISFVVTGLGYYCYFKAIHLVGPSDASVAFFIKPIIAATLAAVFLKEKITWYIVLGIVIVLFASVYNIYKPKKKIK